jgi:anti-anti-sigma regulatory factor
MDTLVLEQEVAVPIQEKPLTTAIEPSISISKGGADTVVALNGELPDTAYPWLKEMLEPIVQTVEGLLIDFSHVQSIGPVCSDYLAGIGRVLKSQRGCVMVVSGLSNKLHADLWGLVSTAHVFDTKAQAIDAMRE